MIYLLVGGAVILFTAGYVTAAWHEAAYWADHATNTHGRGAVFHRGKFFYVVPESDYVQMSAAHINMLTLKKAIDDFPEEA